MLGQRGDGKLLLDAEDRALRSHGLPDQGAGQSRCLRLHRAVLQPVQETLKIELPQPGSIRGAAALNGLGKPSGKLGEAHTSMNNLKQDRTPQPEPRLVQLPIKLSFFKE